MHAHADLGARHAPLRALRRRHHASRAPGSCYAHADGVRQGSEEGVGGDAAAAPLASCTVLEATIEQQAIREMSASIDEILDGLERRGRARSSLPVPSAPAGRPGTDTRTGATDFTTTNTQEKDVDEPDFVKNDGSRIFVLHGGSLVVVAAWPPESARVESVTPLEGQPVEMFLAGDRVAVFSRLGNARLETCGPARHRPRRAPRRSRSRSSTCRRPLRCRSTGTGGRVVRRARGGPATRCTRSSVAPQRGPKLVYWPEENIDWNRKDAVRDALERARAQNMHPHPRRAARGLAAPVHRERAPGGAGVRQLLRGERLGPPRLHDRDDARPGAAREPALDAAAAGRRGVRLEGRGSTSRPATPGRRRRARRRSGRTTPTSSSSTSGRTPGPRATSRPAGSPATSPTSSRSTRRAASCASPPRARRRSAGRAAT